MRASPRSDPTGGIAEGLRRECCRLSCIRCGANGGADLLFGRVNAMLLRIRCLSMR